MSLVILVEHCLAVKMRCHSGLRGSSACVGWYVGGRNEPAWRQRWNLLTVPRLEVNVIMTSCSERRLDTKPC